MIKNKCNCDCHKKQATNELAKCKEQRKSQSRQLDELKKKLLVATIAIAVGGTLVGKEALDKVLEYFQTYDKVKQTIDGIGINNEKQQYDIPLPTYYGVSPSPSTLAVFALMAMIPKPRRK